MTAIRRVKGMYDIVPGAIERWQWIEATARDLLARYGYREIRLPLLEQTALFARAIGEATDVVAKEMYAFEDRNGEHLALRPEGTAGCVRAAIQNGLLQGHVVRLAYAGPMFRRENVQRGRNRQFYQIGVECFGLPGPDVDVEQILLLARLWRELGFRGLRLELNSLGSVQSRTAYRDQLVAYLTRHGAALDEDSRRRLATNPLRILDSKNPALRDVVAGAPSLLDALDDGSRAHFDAVCGALRANGVAFVVNPRLVRGLDYYTRTVFEWVTDELGSQGTVCAGGRYDGLVAAQGGADTPAIGFAMGVDRLVELSEAQGLPVPDTSPDAFLVLVGDAAQASGLRLAEALRDALPSVVLEVNLGGGSFKAQFKRADRSGARVAIVVGDEEAASGALTLKPLRSGQPQRTMPFEAAVPVLGAIDRDGRLPE